MNPTICLTYNIRVDEDIGAVYADNVQFWLRQDTVANYRILSVAQTFMRSILLASGNQLKSVKEKEIYIQYQKLFAKERWTALTAKTETYNTERLANVMKPNRDFILANKDFIDTQIEKSLL